MESKTGFEPALSAWKADVLTTDTIPTFLVPLTGLEPVRPKTADFKSAVSAYSTTAANIKSPN